MKKRKKKKRIFSIWSINNVMNIYIRITKILFHFQGEQDSAISCLNKGITEHFGRYQDEAKRQELSSSLRQVYAKVCS